MWLCLFLLSSASAYFHPARSPDLFFDDANAGDKLILTPYIESGRLEEARRLSEVPSLVGDVKSYSGFLTVDKSCDSNVFFWFFPAAAMESAPVTVWLQGGPGASSLYGLFNENGPYALTSSNVLTLRNYSWTGVSSMIYFDNPVGTGFSYTTGCYSTQEIQVGLNLLSAIQQILKMFPEVESNPFYVTGESYAGKYVPALAYTIHKNNKVKQKINLRGIAIGNGLVDPYHQLHYGEYLYELGLLDSAGRDFFSAMEDKCRSYISAQNWKEATKCFDNLLNGDFQHNTYFYKHTGYTFYFNYLYDKQPPEGQVEELIKDPEVRKSIHVGNSVWHNGSAVEEHLKQDMMKSVAPWLEELLEHYRVLIYNGQLDIIVAYPLTVSYLKELKWSAANEYKKADRHIWRVDDELAGYVKVAGRLTEVMVRNAGHMVPADQPKWAFDLISRFIHNKPYF